MYSFFFMWFSLLTIDPLTSVNGQVLNESTVSLLSTTEGNVTVTILDQQQNAALITPKEQRLIDLTKIIVYPLLLLLGTFGNVMTIAIHKRTTQASPMSVFFVVLALADLVLLYFNCFPSLVHRTVGVHLNKQSSLLCKLFQFCVYTSGVLSAWTLVAMTAQRAVCVLWPHRANVLCTVGKSKVIVVSMVLFMAAMHAHLLYGFDLQTYESEIRCSTAGEYRYFFVTIWSWVDLLIFSLLPWLCLVVSNTLLVLKLNVSVREAEVSLGSGQADRIDDRKKKAKSITVTLIAVSTAFLVLTFPMSLVQILSFVNWMNGIFHILSSSRAIYYLNQISFPLWYTNSSINFYVYCLTGTKFRKEVKRMLRCIFHEDLDKPGGTTKVSTLSSNSEAQVS